MRVLVIQLKKYYSWALRIPRTHIYTFDSLSSKHPQAVKRLSKYLLMEAHDKKQLDEATLNEPKGMQAIVGIQFLYGEVRVGFSYFSGTPST